MKRKYRVVCVLMLLGILAGCQVQQEAVVTPTPEPIKATLVEGMLFTGGEFQGFSISTQVLDECAELPVLLDHSGAEALPDSFPVAALRSGDFSTVAEFMGIKVDDRYGCQRAQSGQLYMDMAIAEFRCGPATLIAHAQNPTGVGLSGILLANHWPNMGDADQFPTGGVDPPYASTGILAWTNADGNVGWGLGTGSYLTPHVGGPHDVWAVSGTGPLGTIVGSDALRDIGMLPMSNHCIINPWFELRKKAGDVPPPPTDGVKIAIMQDGVVLGYIYPRDGGVDVGFSGLELQAEDGNPVWHIPSQAVE